MESGWCCYIIDSCNRWNGIHCPGNTIQRLYCNCKRFCRFGYLSSDCVDSDSKPDYLYSFKPVTGCKCNSVCKQYNYWLLLESGWNNECIADCKYRSNILCNSKSNERLYSNSM